MRMKSWSGSFDCIQCCFAERTSFVKCLCGTCGMISSCLLAPTVGNHAMRIVVGAERFRLIHVHVDELYTE